MSQEDLAAAAHTTQDQISRLELRGVLPRDSRVLDRLVVRLGGESDLWDGLGLFRVTRHCAEIEARNDDNNDAQGATR